MRLECGDCGAPVSERDFIEIREFDGNTLRITRYCSTCQWEEHETEEVRFEKLRKRMIEKGKEPVT
jgi:hypothetical protein